VQIRDTSNNSNNNHNNQLTNSNRNNSKKQITANKHHTTSNHNNSNKQITANKHHTASNLNNSIKAIYSQQALYSTQQPQQQQKQQQYRPKRQFYNIQNLTPSNNVTWGYSGQNHKKLMLAIVDHLDACHVGVLIFDQTVAIAMKNARFALKVDMSHKFVGLRDNKNKID